MDSIECLQEALRLHGDNPEAKVIFMVRNDETCDPADYAYAEQGPVSVQLVELWDDGVDGSLEKDEAFDVICDRIESGDAAGDAAKALGIWEAEKYTAIVVWLGAKA